MRWGFSWDMGPFEMWDAIGLEKSVARMQAEGETVPQWVIEHIEAGNASFYKTEDDQLFYTAEGTFHPVSRNKKEIDLKQIDRKSTRLNSSHVAISYAVFCLKK